MEEYIKNQNDSSNEKDFELAHIIGINSNVSNCVQASPSMSETILYPVGGIVIVEDLKEKNNQIFFRHGKNPISAFRISRRGTLIAVGFVSENIEKKFPTSIILWNYETKSVLYEFTGITKGVSILEFSPDDKFLAASGLDCSFYIWEIETGVKAFSRIYEVRLNFICWTNIFYEGKKPNYSLVTSNVNSINYFYFFYELSSMQYSMKNNKFTLPNTGNNY
jgi:WD40 repeat protein